LGCEWSDKLVGLSTETWLEEDELVEMEVSVATLADSSSSSSVVE